MWSRDPGIGVLHDRRLWIKLIRTFGPWEEFQATAHGDVEVRLSQAPHSSDMTRALYYAYTFVLRKLNSVCLSGSPQRAPSRICTSTNSRTWSGAGYEAALDLAEAARKLDEKQKSNALEFSAFGQPSGIVVENSTKNEAAAHLSLIAAVLPN